jgi:hypothetical protein
MGAQMRRGIPRGALLTPWQRGHDCLRMPQLARRSALCARHTPRPLPARRRQALLQWQAPLHDVKRAVVRRSAMIGAILALAASVCVSVLPDQPCHNAANHVLA